MTSGGKRVRSGPPPDPDSRTSERRGYTLRNLPNTEFKGRPPRWPLPEYQAESDEASEAWNEREQALWRDLWRLPQARAWKMPQYRYLTYQIALYCRQCVRCETPDAKAGDQTIRLRMADALGLSPAGLASLGWKISEDENEAKPAQSDGRPSASSKIIQLPRRMRA